MYDPNYIMDMRYECAKYQNINFLDSDSAVRLFHHHQRIVRESHRDELDPYPAKYIRNIEVFVTGFSHMVKALVMIMKMLAKRSV